MPLNGREVGGREVVDGQDAGSCEARALRDAHPGHQQHVAGRLDLGIAVVAVAAHGVSRVAPSHRLCVFEAFLHDLEETLATFAVDRGDVVEAVHADGAVAEQQFDRRRRGLRVLELLGVGGELQEGRHLGAAGELGVVAPGSCRRAGAR